MPDLAISFRIKQILNFKEPNQSIPNVCLKMQNSERVVIKCKSLHIWLKNSALFQFLKSSLIHVMLKAKLQRNYSVIYKYKEKQELASIAVLQELLYYVF